MTVDMTNKGLDSRRSWVVAMACFFVQVLTFGLTEASGLLFVATIPRYNTTRERASLPYAITYCIRNAVGPIFSYFGRKFGFRLVTLFGCVLSAISVASCFFASDILELTILWGVVFGFSLGLETSLLNVILNEHFDKHLVKANGLNISGASLGTLLLSPIIEHCVETYGLSGTFLIISGLMLNSIPAAFVMLLNKPQEVIKVCKMRQDFQNNEMVDEISNTVAINNTVKVFIISEKPDEVIKVCDLNNSTYKGEHTIQSKIKLSLIQKILRIRPIDNINSSLPQETSHRFWKFKRHSIAHVFNSNNLLRNNIITRKNKNKSSASLHTISNAATIKEEIQLKSDIPECGTLSMHKTNPQLQLEIDTESGNLGNRLTLNLEKTQLKSSLKDTDRHLNEVRHVHSTNSADNASSKPFESKCHNTTKKCANTPTKCANTPTKCANTPTKCTNTPTQSANSKWQLRRLFSEPIYIIIIIGSGIYYFIITTFLTIIVDYATDLGISPDFSTYIVMWVALCDIGGYLFQSWIIELRHLSQSQFASLSFLCLSLASVSMVWCSHFAVLLALIGVFEVGQCGVIVLAAPLVAEHMEAELHATGIASLTILSSPMTLAISPLIGFFRDRGGSYAGLFYVISITSLLCSLLFLLIPKLEKRHRRSNHTFAS